MKRYVAFLDSDGEGGYAVSFPDVPGCYTDGDSYPDAISCAIEALGFHARGLAKSGQPMPEPRTMDEIRAAPEGAEMLAAGCITALIPLQSDEGSTYRMNVTTDPDTGRAVDAAAAAAGLTRSAFLMRAALAYMAERPIGAGVDHIKAGGASGKRKASSAA